MILPLEAEMKDKDKFGKILGLYMAFISLMYGSFGVLGYFSFGEETKDIITTNLGRGLLSTLVQIGLCINLFLTFPLMMNHVYEVIERRFCKVRYRFWLRWAMVLAVTLVALMVPNFADFLSLVGSSVCIVLGFVLPAMFHLIAFKKELVWHGLAFDVALVLMGAVFAVYGTYSSMPEIFEVSLKLATFFILQLNCIFERYFMYFWRRLSSSCFQKIYRLCHVIESVKMNCGFTKTR
ncbi:hypothetical protein P3S67_011229 [Capsicum chacoense]